MGRPRSNPKLVAFKSERSLNEIGVGGRLHRNTQLQTERAKLSRISPVAEAIDYMPKRALRTFALCKEPWLFAGSGSDVLMTTLVMRAKLNVIDTQSPPSDAPAPIADVPDYHAGATASTDLDTRQSTVK